MLLAGFHLLLARLGVLDYDGDIVLGYEVEQQDCFDSFHDVTLVGRSSARAPRTQPPSVPANGKRSFRHPVELRMTSLGADVRYGLRVLRKSPVFTFVVLVTLALGIGANTAIYSVVDSVLIRPLPYANPDRVVMVWEDASYVSFPRNTPAPANYYSWKEMNRVFTDMAATRGMSFNLTGDGPPEQILGRGVTPNFFAVLGVAPALGRGFTEDEDRTGAPVVVISYGLWQRRYAGNPAVIGANVTMNAGARTIIGVMPRIFVFRERNVDFWAPIQFTPAQAAMRNSHYLNVVARLRDGVTVERAGQDMRDVAVRLAREFPDSNSQIGAVVVPIREDFLGDTTLELLVLLGTAGCVLLIACANVASLLLSRAIGRRSEMAVRAALGAARHRLAQPLVVEALLLAAAGGAIGLALAPVGMRVLLAMVPTSIAAPEPRIDPRLLGFTTLLSIATGLVFGIVPAVQASRASIANELQRGGRAAVGGGHMIARDALVVGQVVAACVLLVGAGLLLRTLANLRAIDVGFPAERLLTMRTTVPAATYDTGEKRLAFYERVVAGVRALPGVQHVAYVSTLPFQSIGNTNSYRVEGRVPGRGQDSMFRACTADYLQTLGVQLVEGRLLDDRDGVDAPKVVVINETFARTQWPGESPLGRRVSYGAADAPWRTVVGVVKDVRERGYRLEMKPGTYAPYAQGLSAWYPDNLIVRTSGDPLALAAAVRRVIAGVDPEQPVAAVRTMQEILDLDIADRSQQATLVGVFAALALLLAALGLYGVLSYGVTQRRREIGLRMALGASAPTVVLTIVGRGLSLAAIGLGLGLAIAWAAARAITALLYGVAAADGWTFGGVMALLGLVALVACVLPALRAARVQPMEVLRQE